MLLDIYYCITIDFILMNMCAGCRSSHYYSAKERYGLQGTSTRANSRSSQGSSWSRQTFLRCPYRPKTVPRSVGTQYLSQRNQKIVYSMCVWSKSFWWYGWWWIVYDTVTKGAKMDMRQTFDCHINFTMK